MDEVEVKGEDGKSTVQKVAKFSTRLDSTPFLLLQQRQTPFMLGRVGLQ
jgi:hypothetical protein